MAEVKIVKEADFDAAVIENDRVTVVDFWAPWCGYCVRMMPVFEELAGILGDRADFVKVNTDEEPGLAQRFQVEILPTFAVVKNGEIVSRKIGYIPLSELKETVEQAL